MCLASTSVTMPSSRANDFTMSSTKKVCATGPDPPCRLPDQYAGPAGLASPDGWGFWRTTISPAAPCSRCTCPHPHDFLRLLLVFFFKSSSSPTSPNSPSMTAIFCRALALACG